MVRWWAFLVCAQVCFATGPAASVAQGIRKAPLDPQDCYRVRELTLVRGDIRLYLVDGYLIFGKPVDGTPVSAVFAAEVEGGDAEILVMPPDRSERRSLASYTGAPNLDEHLSAAVLVFSDDTASVLREQIRANPFNRKSEEMGVLLAEKWSPVAHNIGASFESRLVWDLLSGERGQRGFCAIAASGRKLGNFDLLYDPRGREQIAIGQVAYRENRAYFDVWTSFLSRAYRAAERGFEPDLRLSDFRMRATLEPGLLLRVITKVKVKPTRGVLRVVPFDISRQMTVSAATVDGRPAEVFQHESLRSNLIRNSGNDLFLLVPPEPLEPGREYELEFRHEGKVIFAAGNQVYYVGARANWYPHRGTGFANYDLTFRYPKDLDLVTPGEVVEDATEGDWRITRRKTSAPIRLAGFNLGRYERARVVRGGITVEVCANRRVERALEPKMREPLVIPPTSPWQRPRRPEMVALPPPPPPPDPTSRLQELASEIASALKFMSDRFGPPPLPSLTVSPVPGTFGQGFPGLVYLSTLSYLGRQEKPVKEMNPRQQLFFSEILQAHETAHQWWGNVVASAGYHDDWLMESLAGYSALLYLEKRKGVRSLDAVLDEYRDELLAKADNGQTIESAGPIVLGARLESSQAPRAWRTITYGKGSWIMHMLRRRMGDDRFRALLAALRKRYEGKDISTDQFRRLAAEFLPPKSPDPQLENFFEQWVYGTGVPSLKLSYSVRGKAPACKLTGKLVQSDISADFSTLVPIEIRFGNGKSMVHWVRSAAGPVTFTLALRQAPLKVSLDPNRSVLRQ